MLRGHRTYLSLFTTDTTAETLDAPKKRGRDEQLVTDRNALIVHRYYFYSKIKGCKHYQDLLDKLTSEFFLTERTIGWIVDSNPGVLTELKKTSPNAIAFKKKYPFMNWDC